MPTGSFPKKQSASGDFSPAVEHEAKRVLISELLCADTIMIVPEGKSKDAILKSLVRRLCEKKGLDKKTFLAEVIKREEEGISTTLDTGLSLPHARMDSFDKIVAALAIIPGGVVDPKQSELTIRLMFLFFSPNKQESFHLHLQLLRGIASLFQKPLIDELVRSSVAAALELIRKAEKQ